MKTEENKSPKPPKNKRFGVLITGASGFLGSHLAEHFLSQGHLVIGLDNFCTGSKSNVPYLEKVAPKHKGACFKFLKCDVSEAWPEKKLFSWIQKEKVKLRYVFHFASPASPPLYQKLAKETLWVNSKGTENALRFADQGRARLVFASTSEVYGDPEIHPQPESYWGRVNPWGIRSCYDEAKRFGEALISHHNRLKKKQHGWVRIFNTYGPRMNPFDGRVVINFLLQGLQGQELTVYGNGHQTRSFCYVDDLINGIVKYAENGLSEPVNIGCPKEFTVLELATIVQSMNFKSKPGIKFLEAAPDDPQKRRPQIDVARSKLDWYPQIDLAQGLEKTLGWLRTQKNL